MNDFFAGRLAEEKTKDYLREVEHDRPAGLLRASMAERPASGTPAAHHRPFGRAATSLRRHLVPHRPSAFAHHV